MIVDDADRDDEASLYFDGRVAGNTMQGEIRRGVGNAEATVTWQATRVKP